MIKRLFRILAGGLAVLALAAPAAAGEPILGVWTDPGTGAQIEIVRCGDGVICGDLVRLPAGSPPRDVENPDPRLRHRPLLGMRVLSGFGRTGPGIWEGGGAEGRRPGRIYLPTRGDMLGDGGHRYRIRLAGSDRLEISIENCGFLTCGFKRVWRRAGPAERRPATERLASD